MKPKPLFAVLASALLVAALSATVTAHDMGSMSSSAMNGPNDMGGHMGMGPHMTMSALRPASEADLARARELLGKLREGIEKYQDFKLAMADRYVPFLPSVPQDVYHFTNYAVAYREYTQEFDPARPGSLLYTKQGKGKYKLVGAMYSAPAEMSEEEIDKRVPLSVAQWHKHVNICLPKQITLNDLIRGEIGAGSTEMAGTMDASALGARDLNHTYGFMADGRFGFKGTIADPENCESAGGHFIKTAWGWMVHVYPFTSDDIKVAFSQNVPKD